MKGQMLDDDRRRFLAWPDHLQHSLYHEEAVKELQDRSIAERIEAAGQLKEAGNELLHEGDAVGAVNEYERALALFHYARSTDPGWKTQGIRDCNLVLHHDTGSTPVDREAVSRLRVALLLNLALARLHLNQPAKAVALCTEALTHDPSCAKAFVRRAKARIAPASAGAAEEEEAIRDLREATSLLSRLDAPVPAETALLRRAGSELRRLQASKRARAKRDAATFSGMLSRGRIYGEDEAGARRRRARDRATAGAEGGEGEEDLRARLADLRTAARSMRERGNISAATELESLVASSEQRLAAAAERRRSGAAQQQQAHQSPLDFDNPTKQMRQDARAHGCAAEVPGGKVVAGFPAHTTRQCYVPVLDTAHPLACTPPLAASTSTTQPCERSCSGWRRGKGRRRSPGSRRRGAGPPSG